MINVIHFEPTPKGLEESNLPSFHIIHDNNSSYYSIIIPDVECDELKILVLDDNGQMISQSNIKYKASKSDECEVSSIEFIEDFPGNFNLKIQYWTYDDDVVKRNSCTNLFNNTTNVRKNSINVKRLLSIRTNFIFQILPQRSLASFYLSYRFFLFPYHKLYHSKQNLRLLEFLVKYVFSGWMSL